MAQSYIFNGQPLVTPGAYPNITVNSTNAGLATTGVLMLIGESDSGPDYTKEIDLNGNRYGPDQLADVLAKYGEGKITAAFRVACAPSGDLNGSFSKAVIVKTNPSTKASGTLTNLAATTYGTLYSKLEGAAGNILAFSTTAAQAEIIPTTGSWTYIPAVGTVNAELRISGGAALSLALSANSAPNATQAALSALTGLTATGGVNRAAITVSGTLAVTANPGGAGVNVIDVTRSVAWAVQPIVGDTLVIPTGSVIAATLANIGAYVIIASTATTVRATKLSDAGKAGGVAGTITAPATVGAAAISALTDFQAFSPLVVTIGATVLDGVGKTLEFAELATGTDLLSRTTYQLGTTTVVTWVSKVGVAKDLTSAAETMVTLNISRTTDNVTETLTAGGNIGLQIGYIGTTATFTIDKVGLTFATTVTGGTGASIPATLLANFPSIGDLVAFLNSQTGYTASVGNAVIGQLPLIALDSGTYAFSSTWGALNGRIKTDAYDFYNIVSTSGYVQLENPAKPEIAGLPIVKILTYLANGTKAGTTAATVLNALTALEGVTGNFVVPLFSRDATLDIVAGFTDSSSTYTIDAINLAAKAHVLKMSTIKKRKNRQAFLSKEDSYANQKTAASTLSSSRCAMTFQDFKEVGSDGLLHQYLPWMGATLAAAMQAAGFYRSIFNKDITTAGIVHAAGDFNSLSDSQVEDALNFGLCPAHKNLSGGFSWISDQTTYTKTDNNFVFNSIQAMYAADIIALSTAQNMEQAFVGASLADVSATIALTYLEGLMGDLLRQKLIAPSDDAPKGYKNVIIKINGPVMLVSVEVKLATSLYFIPLQFSVSQVVQTASSVQG